MKRLKKKRSVMEEGGTDGESSPVAAGFGNGVSTRARAKREGDDLENVYEKSGSASPKLRTSPRGSLGASVKGNLSFEGDLRLDLLRVVRSVARLGGGVTEKERSRRGEQWFAESVDATSRRDPGKVNTNGSCMLKYPSSSTRPGKEKIDDYL
ncbi:hypothetical protein Sjap_023760 [Stephania japonica]|uniref:Uncharacterized protein n=1 Tax=Stephania japonica TaxID=461633 RepID=A0AAP0HJ93_9MAGN